MNILKAGFLSLLFAVSCGIFSNAWAKEIIISTLEHDTPEVNTAIKVMTEVYKRIGYDMTIVCFPGKRSLIEANSGAAEGELLRIEAIEKHYPNLVRVPYAIGRLTAITLVRKGQAKVSNLSELRGKKVGIIRGVEYTEILTKNLDRQILNSIDSLFKMLLSGRADVILFPELDARTYVKNHGLENKIDINADPIIDLPLYHFLHKDSQVIADELAAELKRLMDNGILEQLIKNAQPSQN